VIFRPAIAIGLVWLCMPRHPDLGLPSDSAFLSSLERRGAVFQRLVEIRQEIKIARDGDDFVVAALSP
jgi:hypothetical protein